MAQTPPFRNRPNLHLSISPFSTSSNPSTQGTPTQTPFYTPFTTTNYSPFRSASLKLPTPYHSTTQFPLHAIKQGSRSDYRNHTFYRVRRMLTSRFFACLIIIIGLCYWWSRGWKEELNIVGVGVNRFGPGNHLFKVEATKSLQFFPAANPKIHVRRVESKY